MIDETIVIEACNKTLDQIADGDMDGAIATISNLRADNQKKVDEFEKCCSRSIHQRVVEP